MKTKRENSIKGWKHFGRRVRAKGCALLARLDEFPGAILVTGCQRSGTTAIARMITTSDGMVKYWFGSDDELDAALILSGNVEHRSEGRYCFQTTYVNECYKEYYNHHGPYKIIWVIRNPHSVVYSMLNNWRRFAFNELFDACGVEQLNSKEMHRYEYLGRMATSRLRRACFSYIGKTSQLVKLKDRLPERCLVVIDYDEIVPKKNELLPKLYERIDLPYREEYAEKLNSANLHKAANLSSGDRKVIGELCTPIYRQARELVSV